VESNIELLEMATIGGGCFWCTEAIMDELEGVIALESGYAGGKTEDPTYRQITNGDTGHAEVVLVQFNPQVISYADLLRVYFATHNPTSLNRQGADVGTKYRSIILYHNESQRQIANEVIQEIQPHFDKPIVTEVVPFTKFYKADQRHQNYYRNNPEYAYCQTVINPKLRKLRMSFGKALKKKAGSTR
jgi:methionine-S-sulfoxide reductase